LRSVLRFASGFHPTRPRGKDLGCAVPASISCSCLRLLVASNRPHKGLSPSVIHPCPTGCGKSPPWPFSPKANLKKAKVFQGSQPPHPAADDFIHGLLTHLRSGLRPSHRHTTRIVPQLSHEHWYNNWGGLRCRNRLQAGLSSRQRREVAPPRRPPTRPAGRGPWRCRRRGSTPHRTASDRCRGRSAALAPARRSAVVSRSLTAPSSTALMRS
jgi:hypothetical protein